MLKFSNSQSCKEFTLEGEFYRRHTVAPALQRFHAGRYLAGLYRYISMYGEACKLFHPN